LLSQILFAGQQFFCIENTKEEMQKEGYLLSIDVLMEEYGIL